MLQLKGAMLFFGLSLVVLSVQGRVVSFIEPCQINDNDCVLKSAKIALPHIAAGLPNLGVPIADPLVLDDAMTDNKDLNIKFKNMTVKGVSQCTFLKFVRPKQFYIKFVADCPIIATGLYNMKGNLIGVPVKGDGDFVIKTDNVRLEVEVFLKMYQGKDGEDHYKIDKFDYKYEPLKDFVLIFNNLFGGDREQAAPVEAVIKDNGNLLVAEMGKPVITELFKKAASFIDKLFYSVPAKELEIQSLSPQA